MIYESQYYNQNYLAHFGVKGMKWGVRRYQNPDGSLTSAGKFRQAKKEYKLTKKELRKSGLSKEVQREQLSDKWLDIVKNAPGKKPRNRDIQWLQNTARKFSFNKDQIYTDKVYKYLQDTNDAKYARDIADGLIKANYAAASLDALFAVATPIVTGGQFYMIPISTNALGAAARLETAKQKQ